MADWRRKAGLDTSPEQTRQKTKGTPAQQAVKQAGSVSGGQQWGAYVISRTDAGRKFVVSWNRASREAAIKAAVKKCNSSSTSGDCSRPYAGPRRGPSPDRDYVTHVAFSSEAQRNDLARLFPQWPGMKNVATGMIPDLHGQSLVINRPCVLVWSELSTNPTPGTPVARFGDTEAEVRASFQEHNSRNANVSRNWREEIQVRCNDR